MDEREIRSRFGDPENKDRPAAWISRHLLGTALNLDAQVPDGRYKSMMLTAMEEAEVWALKALRSTPEGLE